MIYHIKRKIIYQCAFWYTLVVCFSRLLSKSQADNTTDTKPTGKFIPPVKDCSSIGKDFWTICWLNTPPYVYKNNPKNHSTVTGIMIEALGEGLRKCSCSTKFTFKQVETEEELFNCSKSNNIDIVLPFPRKRAANPNWFFTVVDSPNIYLVLNRNSVEKKAKERVLEEFFNSVWTIAVLTVLLAIIFGILVWFLDMTWNQEQFPPTFYPGSLEGIWWSFVTLTTVGYGDKTPKFPIARLFAIVWMFVGMGMVSLLTATMTKALTQAAFDNQNYLQSREIGVVKHSITYDEAVKNGAIPVKFFDLKELYTALDHGTVDGILADTFVATYVKNNPSIFKFKHHLFVARSYDASYPVAIYLGGGATNNKENLDTILSCFKPTFEKLRERRVYEIVDKYIQPPRIDASVSKSTIGRIKFEFYMFKSTENTFIFGVQILGGTLAVLILFGIMWQIVYHRKSKSRNISFRGDNESVVMATREHRLQDITKLQLITEKLEEVDLALGKLSEFRNMCEQYKKDLQRYDNGIVNGVTTHAREATENKGFSKS